MQSMQNLSQQQPMMSMEDFLAQVAWPGVQPFFLGGSEAPVVQDPSFHATEDTPEAGEVEDTPEAKAEVEDTLVETPEEASGATDADMDEDYVADIIATQGTWDPWPIPAQD